MNRFWIASALICGLAACQPQGRQGARVAPSGKTSWSYEGATGPEHWGELSPDYVVARTGRRQSPVDIVTSKVARKDVAPLEASYRETSLEILNNGHTVEVESREGGPLAIDGHRYDLAPFHFHSPSEHTIDGRHAPMELHLVHKDASGKLAVIGVLIEEGSAHPELALLWRHLPEEPGQKEAVESVGVNVSGLLPRSLASYRYSGSLTTPPCSEDVSWFVLQVPIQASADQVESFRRVIHGNNRPTQPLHGRVVTASD